MSLLICGIANPRGEGDDYNGLHLKDSEIDEVVQAREMIGLPVKIEHKGIGIGTVVSAFKDGDGRLNCVMEINRDEVEGAIAQEWIHDSTASELSLGYVVDIEQSDPAVLQAVSGKPLRAGRKKILEVSIVRKGAREGCRIYSHAKKVIEQDHGKDWREAFGI
eukprot:766114-Hanusia_phi.AAC.8